MKRKNLKVTTKQENDLFWYGVATGAFLTAAIALFILAVVVI